MASVFEFAFVSPAWQCVDSQLPSKGHWMRYNSDNGTAVMERDAATATVHTTGCGLVSYKYLRHGSVPGTTAVRYKHCRPKKKMDDVLIREVAGVLVLNTSVEPTTDCKVIVNLATMSGRVVYTSCRSATSTIRCLDLRNDATAYLKSHEEISRHVSVALVIGTTHLRGNCILWRWIRYQKFLKRDDHSNKLKLVKRVNAKTTMNQLTLNKYFRKI